MRMSLTVQVTLFLGIFQAIAMIPQQRPAATRSGPTPHTRTACGSFEAVSHMLGGSLGDGIPDNSSPLLENGGTAALHNSDTDLGSSTHRCGAVLISDRYLLTAAHCMVGSESLTSISLGREDLDITPFPGPDTYRIEQVNIHPAYGHATEAYNDIAILKTERKVQYSNKIWPFCIPDSNLALNDYLPMVIAGWGEVDESQKASTLQTAYVRYVKNPRCEALWRQHASDDFDAIRQFSYPQGLTNQVLCAGREGVDACGGDSGGPLSHQNSDGYHTVYGLIGERNSCPIFPITPGFYTNVANYIDWIFETTGPLTPSHAQEPQPSLGPATNTSPEQPVVGFNGQAPGVVTGECKDGLATSTCEEISNKGQCPMHGHSLCKKTCRFCPSGVNNLVSSGASIGGTRPGGDTSHLSDNEFINVLSGISSNGQVSSSAFAGGSDSITSTLSEVVDERNAAISPTDRIRQERSRSPSSQAVSQN